jgi:Spy/CpxP family protein refolding chaperone
MASRLTPTVIIMLATALLAAAGCEPKCREVEPIAEAQADLRERVDDRLDDVDVSDAQRAKIQKLFTELRPALERMRAQTLPRQREVVAELRRAAPDRTRLALLIEQNVDATQEYIRAVVDVMLRAHRVLTPEQRKALAARAAEPSQAFEGSFWLDRAVDYLLLRIEANEEQRRWFDRIKLHLLERGRLLQRQVDAIRAEAAAEFARDAPDPARVHALFERGRGLARAALIDLAGFYLLFASKLEPRQRALLDAELIRFEPCRAQAAAVR